jgi:hypothetical protein
VVKLVNTASLNGAARAFRFEAGWGHKTLKMKKELKYLTVPLLGFLLYIGHTYLWQSKIFQLTYLTLPLSLYGFYRYVRYTFNF